MAKERTQRKLAAILAADVVGYSRLMGEDEAGTLAALKQLRSELIDPTIADYHGRLVKLMGDGALVEFASAVDAVECAVHIQSEMSHRNADTPENTRIQFRIGVNVGDIIIDGDDIYGDGVNVAARLEGAADPGGVCISEDAYRQVNGKIDHAFGYLGERTLKNIAAPVRAYLWRDGQVSDARMPDAKAEGLAPNHKPSIAVLPFNNMSNDPDQEYFADGISEDLITDLSKLEGLTVIARNSSFTFKGRQVDVKEAAQTLGVRNILEGSVRKMGNRVRINAQLIDGITGSHIWADRYDGSYEQIFDLQDEILEKIVAALEVNLTGRDRDNITHRSTVNTEAYDLLLRGRTKFYAMNPAAFMQARDLFQQAIDIDPEFADAYVYLSFIEMVGWLFILPDLGDDLREAHRLAEKAIALDDRLGMARTQLGWIQIWMREYDLGIANLERGVEIDPTNAEGYAYLAEGLNYAGDPERAVEMTRKAQEYDPVLPPNCQFHLGHSYYLLGKFNEAAETISGALKLAPEFLPAHIILAAVYTELGQMDMAEKEIEIIGNLLPEYTVAEIDRIYPHRPTEVKSRLLGALGQAGMRQN
jgi:TolB-like protein